MSYQEDYNWLLSQTNQTSGNINDLWKKYLRDRGYTGSNPDMLNEFLSSFDYSGSLSDKLKRWNNDFWPTGASLHLDFKNGKYASKFLSKNVSNLLTCTRASEGYAERLDGSIQSFAANELCITDKGLLPQEARTNGIRNSNMAGAAIGTWPTHWEGYDDGGVKSEIVGTGESYGSKYVDVWFHGTNNSGTGKWPKAEFDDGDPVLSVAQGDDVTLSAYVQVIDGTPSHTPRLYFREYDGATVGSLQADIVSVSSTRTRISFTAEITGATTDRVRLPRFYCTVPDTETIDFTLRIWVPQIEKGAFASSPILTEGSAAARAADVVSFANLDWMGSEGTFLIDFDTSPNWLAGDQFLLTEHTNNRWGYNNASSLALSAWDGTNSHLVGYLSGDTSYKVALAYDATGTRSSTDGAAISSDNVVLTQPASLYLGCFLDGSRQWNAPIRSLTYWPEILSDAQLQELSS